MYDPELYRDKQEVEEWKKRDPIPNLIERLKRQNLWQEEEWTRIEADVAREIDRSVEFSEAGHWEPVEELTRFVYSEARPHLFPPPRAGEDEGGGSRPPAQRTQG
jgi:pyruvate dehydrogenase E1 component alpha subunit/2-oxoisovalerate dehydrogenase E1 component